MKWLRVPSPIGGRKDDLLETVIGADAHDEWRSVLISKYGVVIHVCDCHEIPEGGCHNLLEIVVDPSTVGRILEELHANPTVEGTDLDRVDDRTLKGLAKTKVCLGCSRMVGSETFLVDVRMGQDGRIFQRIITVERDSVRQAIT